jgi:hypothetical protein
MHRGALSSAGTRGFTVVTMARMAVGVGPHCGETGRWHALAKLRLVWTTETKSRFSAYDSNSRHERPLADPRNPSPQD